MTTFHRTEFIKTLSARITDCDEESWQIADDVAKQVIFEADAIPPWLKRRVGAIVCLANGDAIDDDDADDMVDAMKRLIVYAIDQEIWARLGRRKYPMPGQMSIYVWSSES